MPDFTDNLPVLIGVGNAMRRDDGAGILVARRVREILGGAVHVIEASGEGAALMAAWEPYDEVYLVDAVKSGASPGTVWRIEATTEKVPTDFFHYSTHAFSVAEAVELARVLGKLPKRLRVTGIEGTDFDYGEELTEAVARAVEEVAAELIVELSTGSPAKS